MAWRLLRTELRAQRKVRERGRKAGIGLHTFQVSRNQLAQVCAVFDGLIGFIADGTNGDIADLQYFLYKADTTRGAALGVNAHSFS